MWLSVSYRLLSLVCYSLVSCHPAAFYLPTNTHFSTSLLYIYEALLCYRPTNTHFSTVTILSPCPTNTHCSAVLLYIWPAVMLPYFLVVQLLSTFPLFCSSSVYMTCLHAAYISRRSTTPLTDLPFCFRTQTAGAKTRHINTGIIPDNIQSYGFVHRFH